MAFQILFCSLIAVLLGYLIVHADFFLLLGVSGLGVIALSMALNFKTFLIILFAVKPFVDLTWNVPLFYLGNDDINPLSAVAAIVFLAAAYQYVVRRGERRPFNEGPILIFLGLNVFAAAIAVLYFDRAFIPRVNTVMRLFDSYLLYLVLHRHITDEAGRLRIVGVVWVSTLLVNIVNVLLLSTNYYYVDISQGVERFAGLYNDPGGPSFNAVISLLFGTLYLEMFRSARRLPLSVRLAYAATIGVTGILLALTITKGALVMFVIFLTLWFGVYKRRTWIILPLVALSLYFLYTEIEAVQKRVNPDINFLKAEHITLADVRPVGSGRVGLWESVLSRYDEDYTFFQKMFGSSIGYGAHNQYIAYLMQVGVVGLSVFMVIVARFFLRLASLFMEHRRPEIFMGLVLLAMFAVLGITGTPFDYTTLMWYLMVLLSIINCEYYVSHETGRKG